MNYVDQLLAQNETLVLITRQSWVVLVREAIIDLIGALIFIGITLIASGLPFLQPFGWALGVLILLPAGRFVYRFLQWANEEYIVTNRRVIQINGLVNKNVIDSSLEKVNDVRMTQSVLGRLFNYGDVEILTASELGSNLFQRIGDPIGFKTAMLNEKEKLGFAENPSVAPPAAPRPADIPTLIASLSAMRKEGMITEEEFEKKKAELLARM
jgi:uncharacterized membrane protein YdbT with pleckstrin-like domain